MICFRIPAANKRIASRVNCDEYHSAGGVFYAQRTPLSMGARRHHSGTYDPARPGSAAGILVVCTGGGPDRVRSMVYEVLLVKGEGHEDLCVSHAALSGADPAAPAGITGVDRA